MAGISEVPRSAWRALFAAQVGWMLDAADFLLYTFALRSIQVEFGLSKPQSGLLVTVALIAGAFGGIFFGRLADRIGRVQAMTWSMILYSVATAGQATSGGLLTLLIWRSLVGFGMGGEWSSGSVLVSESWPPEHRAKAAGIMQSGWAIGALIAAGVSALVLERYGWRVLFLLGALPAVVAIWIRRSVPEPEIWRNSRAAPGGGTERPRTSPFRAIFGKEFRRFTVVASLLASVVLIAYWGLFSWLPGFLATPVSEGGAGLTLTRSALWIVLVQLGALAGYLSFGWIADAIGRRPAFALFMVGGALVVPMYALAPSTRVLTFIGPLVGFFGSGYFSVFGAMLSELYPTSIRATAQGFCYNIGRLASAAAPYMIGVAAENYGLGTALTMNAFFFVVGAFVVWLLPETRGRRLQA